MKNLLIIGTVFLLGAATGISVALLNAPDSGEKTRKKLRDGLAETRSRAEGAISDAQARARGAVEEVQNRAQTIVHEIGDKVQHGTEKLREATSR